MADSDDSTPERRPRNGGSGEGAPDGSGSLISEDELKEVEEWNPKVAKTMRGLVTRMERLRSQFQESEMRRAIADLNGYINTIGRRYELDGILGRDARAASTKQHELRKEIINEASIYQRRAAAENIVVDDEEAIEHVVMRRYRRRIEEAIETRAGRKVEASVRARAGRLDLVPSSGGTRRLRGVGEGDDRTNGKYCVSRLNGRTNRPAVSAHTHRLTGSTRTKNVRKVGGR